MTNHKAKIHAANSFKHALINPHIGVEASYSSKFILLVIIKDIRRMGRLKLNSCLLACVLLLLCTIQPSYGKCLTCEHTSCCVASCVQLDESGSRFPWWENMLDWVDANRSMGVSLHTGLFLKLSRMWALACACVHNSHARTDIHTRAHALGTLMLMHMHTAYIQARIHVHTLSVPHPFPLLDSLVLS